MFDNILWIFLSIMSLPTIIWLITYLIPQIYMAYIRDVPDLKKQYNNVQWSLVTGGSSGIGKSLCFGLAKQGLNVVIISLDDDLLKQTLLELQKEYPKQQFRTIGINFTYGNNYMNIITEKLNDIKNDIRIIFCNAGYMLTGFIDQTNIIAIQNNIECNVISHINISHYFLQYMIQNQTTGCIVFTSSVAGFIPTPFAVMYASTKAMISQYAASLHIENKSHGIDICAIHPSPVNTNFYNNLSHKVDMIEAAAKNAISPNDIINDIFKSIGCCAYRDLGGKFLFARCFYLQHSTCIITYMIIFIFDAVVVSFSSLYVSILFFSILFVYSFLFVSINNSISMGNKNGYILFTI